MTPDPSLPPEGPLTDVLLGVLGAFLALGVLAAVGVGVLAVLVSGIVALSDRHRTRRARRR